MGHVNSTMALPTVATAESIEPALPVHAWSSHGEVVTTRSEGAITRVDVVA